MSLSFPDLFALITYLSIVMAIGLYFSRKNTSTEEYFVGGRSFSGWVIGLSLVGTSISSITFLAYPGDAYKTAWLRYLPNLMLPVAIFVAAYVFLPFFRRGNTITAYEYLEHRFGPSIRIYGAITFIVGQLVRISLILYLLSLLIHELTGLSAEMSIITGGVFVAVYTIVGGIDAVIWTDVLQTIVLVVGGLFCLAVIISNLPGGLEQIISIASEHGKLAFSELRNGQLVPLEWSFSLQDKTGTMMLLLGLTAWLTEYSANQNTVQRFCASKSDHEARKAMFVCAFTSLPIWAFYMFLGTALYVFFQVFPTETASQILNGEQKAEQILPYFINHYLPSGIAGIVIAAALAAAMSSLDSSINAISTVSIVDIYKRFSKSDSDNEKKDLHYLRIAKLIAVIVSAMMIFGAMLLMNAETKTLQDTATILVSIISGGVLGIYLLGFFTNQGDARAVWSGLIFTALFTIWTILAKKELLPDDWLLPFDLYYTSIVGNFLMFIIGFFASRFIFPRRTPVGDLSVWGK